MANLDELRRVLLEMASPNTLRDGVVTLLDDVRGLVASRERHRDTQVVHHARIDQLASGCSETSTRVDQLADQLAGLQQLVQSLVNEQGEGITTGCEPRLKHEIGQLRRDAIRIRDEREGAVHLAAEANRERDQLRAEVERLTRERDEAIREGNYALQCTDERVEAAQMRMVEAVAQYLEQRATEALASNRRGDVSAINAWNAEHRAAGLTNAVDALRSGTWKEQP